MVDVLSKQLAHNTGKTLQEKSDTLTVSVFGKPSEWRAGRKTGFDLFDVSGVG